MRKARRFRIEITDDDLRGLDNVIEGGRDCPVARALRRRFKSEGASVGFERATLTGDRPKDAPGGFWLSKKLEMEIMGALEGEGFQTGAYYVTEVE